MRRRSDTRLVTDGGQPGDDPTDDTGNAESGDPEDTYSRFDETTTTGPTPGADEMSERTGGQDTTDDTAATTDAHTTTTEETTQSSRNDATDDNDAILAALLSFFLIPGIGHFVVDGKQDRGVSILLFYVVWLVLGWGIVGVGSAIAIGFIGMALGVMTFGFGLLLWFLWPVIMVVVGVGEILIRALAAVDAYEHSAYMDTVTETVDDYR